jgi:uncharacterized protein YcbK (DUF882 family)
MKQGQLSKHFWRSEFACRCGCGQDTVDGELIRVQEDMRAHFTEKYSRARVTPTSGCRCRAYNEKVQHENNPDYIPFSSHSWHMTGKADDFIVERYVQRKCIWVQVPPDEVADYLESEYPDSYGIGRYDDFTHLDVRPGKARWDKRS